MKLSTFLFVVVLLNISVVQGYISLYIYNSQDVPLLSHSFMVQESNIGAPLPRMSAIKERIVSIDTLGCEEIPKLNFSSPYENKNGKENENGGWIAMIKRGECLFETKIYNAQKAGASYCIVYNNEVTPNGYHQLIIMTASTPLSEFITIPSGFISFEDSQEILKIIDQQKLIYKDLQNQNQNQERSNGVDGDGNQNTNLTIDYFVFGKIMYEPYSSLSTKWTFVIFGSSCSLLVAFLLFVFISFRVVRRQNPNESQTSHRIPENLLKKIPLAKLGESDINKENNACPICLDDFCLHDIVRDLPCGHHFHKSCIDLWFEKSNLCPFCKRDVSLLLSQKKNSKKPVTLLQRLFSRRDDSQSSATNGGIPLFEIVSHPSPSEPSNSSPSEPSTSSDPTPSNSSDPSNSSPSDSSTSSDPTPSDSSDPSDPSISDPIPSDPSDPSNDPKN